MAGTLSHCHRQGDRRACLNGACIVMEAMRLLLVAALEVLTCVPLGQRENGGSGVCVGMDIVGGTTSRTSRT